MGIDRARRGYSGRSHTTRMFAPDSKAGAEIVVSLVDQLERFTNLFQAKIVRSAVYAGAKVLADELELRVPIVDGVLHGSIYTWYDYRNSGRSGKQIYYVGYNKAKARHWFNVEYGHWRVNKGIYVDGEWIPFKTRLANPVWVEPRPYLRSTWDAKSGAAIVAMGARMAERIRELRSEEIEA